MLSGKVAFVTGAASGIGRGAALRFAQEGAKVVLADMQDDEGQKLEQEIAGSGGQAVYVHCDVSQSEDVKRAVDTAKERFGRLDIVYANAGINGVWTPIEELQPDEWDKTLDINLKGDLSDRSPRDPASAGCGGRQYSHHEQRQRQPDVLKSRRVRLQYQQGRAGGVRSMAALELGRYNIRVNTICPGAIHTNIDERTFKRDTEEVEVKAEIDNSDFLNEGQGEPQDVADVCLFLASDLSRHVTGVEIYVDGGASLLK
jgi:NAD(P)-dependent dehydrogenase (short-subunit alcohol dehydrogenase family)